MKQDKVPKQKMVVLNESNMKGAKIDMLTSILEKLSKQQRQSNPFNPEHIRVEDTFEKIKKR